MIGEIDGVKIIVTPEQYKKAQKSLEEQLIEKDKEIERLNKTNNEIFKANETLVEEIERLNNILDRLGLLDKDIDKETKIVNMTITLPKWLKDIGKKNKINFSKLLQESLYEVLQIGSDKE